MGHDFGDGVSEAAVTIGGEFAGSTPAPLTGAGAKQKLRMRPSPNFLLLAHPRRWQVMAGEVLPCLHELRQSPGVENVSPRGADMTPAISKKLKDGWTIIPHNVIEGGYVRKFDGYRGPVHLSRWQTPRQIGLRAAKPVVDLVGYHEFLRDLLKRGIVPAPLPEVLDELVDRARSTVERLAGNTLTEAGKARHQRAVDEMHIIEIACGYRKPKPKSGPKRKRAAKPKPTEAVDG